MKIVIIFITLLAFKNLAYSQTKFIYNENGLLPQYVDTSIDSLSKTKLYNSTLNWITKTYNTPDIKINNQIILLSGVKENLIKVDKRFLHIKYTIEISFEEGLYSFKPLRIQSKTNSKYDMGWKDFSLTDGKVYFKKGKVIKKTKPYVKDIPALLNEINTSLYHILTSE
ncbi:hypothetical protein [Hyunsoonleella pacifica]|uniref:DUF4468 domain-containing protein n=1 Tax=Hyunsoonleella pacifica TaxID=1080224 RepID=A0A4Q9FK26_9FLAO|nr:hypothetical protein [Hyunsoonleella pacifica]TBN13745.1 hypothetical protein EYD46_14705 [Hyunsoonleella pacifica]GGD25267.1 hypothetical protein GCM10011368_29160 [Hyunsoonleella pacifica]